MWLTDLLSKHDVLCKDGSTEPPAFTAKGKDYIGLYFSAHWCPPCRGFTPQLAEWYRKQSRAELVFISSDHDKAAFQEYFEEMPWKGCPFDPKLNETLRERFSVQGIPTLVILDALSGELITDEARADIDDDVNLTFSQWTPNAVKEKQARKQRAKEQMKRELPVVVQEELDRIMLVGPTDRTKLAEVMAKVAAQEFGRPLPQANLQHAVANMFDEFEENKSGLITPASMAQTVSRWLKDVSEPDAVAHYLKPETVRELVFLRFLQAGQEEAKEDEEWAAGGEMVRQCTAIFEKFDQDGDGHLLKGEFQAFLQATIQQELDGLYDHLNQAAKTGVEAKQLYTSVYKRVFVGRREGDAAAQIRKDYATLCAPLSKL